MYTYIHIIYIYNMCGFSYVVMNIWVALDFQVCNLLSFYVFFVIHAVPIIKRKYMLRGA